jgi:serine phosphatase RsbU (regulator of sigma subunit)
MGDKSWSFANPATRKEEGVSLPLNLPLAIASDTYYEQLSIPMGPGDQLFIYTDGIIEAPSPDGEIFGMSKLKQVLDENINHALPEIKMAVLNRIYDHTQNILSHDDVTLISLEIR